VDIFDVAVIVIALGAALGGYRLGFLGRVTSWLGLAVGFYVAIRVLPTIIVKLSSSSPAVQLWVAIVVLIGGAVLGQALGLIVGSRLHGALPLGPLRLADRTVGAGVGIIGVVAALWMLLPSIASVSGWPARTTAGSAIARWVSRDLPTPPDALQVLRRVLQQDAPQVFAELGPGTAQGPVPQTNPLPSTVTADVISSTVKVEGEACNRIFEGSGFAVAANLIVTNAHVVAGEAPGATSVLLPTGAALPATVVMFDPNRDIALLEVAHLGERPLPIGTPRVNGLGAVFGHPNGQDPIQVTPARISADDKAVGRDLYDKHDTTRDVLILAAALAHGDSGGPLIDPAGQVVGVAFAVSANHATTSYALSTTELRAALSEPRNLAGTSTGSCLTG
jgi:S1-C subfamily serine protease